MKEEEEEALLEAESAAAPEEPTPPAPVAWPPGGRWAVEEGEKLEGFTCPLLSLPPVNTTHSKALFCFPPTTQFFGELIKI